MLQDCACESERTEEWGPDRLLIYTTVRDGSYVGAQELRLSIDDATS